MATDGPPGADAPLTTLPVRDLPSTGLSKTSRSLEQWKSLVHEIPGLVMLVGTDGTIQFSNRAVAEVSPEAMIGTHVDDYVEPQYRKPLRAMLEEVLRTGEIRELETQTSAPDGGKSWFSIRIGPFREHDAIAGVTVVATRITQRKQAELALQASERHFHSLAAIAPVGIFRTNSERHCIYVNQRCIELMGRPEEELVKFNWIEALHPDDRERVTSQWEREGPAGNATHSEHRFVRPDGSIVWVLSATIPEKTKDGRVVGHVGTLVDITEKKEAEAELLAEQTLLRKLLEIQEKERQMVSCEIHDGIVQHVVGAKMMVDRISEEEDLRGTPCEEAAAVVSQALGDAIEDGRRLIGELRPMVIDERGIVEAVRYLTEDRRLCGGIDVHFQHRVTFDRFPSMLEGTIFRIVQEAITNAVRHSKSPSIDVTLTEIDGSLHIEILDQGVGFDRAKVASDRFGLRSIEERARLFGGTATIDSKPGEGTRISVELPLYVE